MTALVGQLLTLSETDISGSRFTNNKSLLSLSYKHVSGLLESPRHSNVSRLSCFSAVGCV